MRIVKGIQKRSLADDSMGSLIILQLGPLVYFLAVRGSEWDREFTIEFEVTKFDVDHVHRCYESLNIGDYVHREKPETPVCAIKVTRKKRVKLSCVTPCGLETPSVGTVV